MERELSNEGDCRVNLPGTRCAAALKNWRAHFTASVAAFTLIGIPSLASADIIWSGDYETGNFMQWHVADESKPNLSGMPKYCRPVGPTDYYGDGSCLEVVSDIVRNGNYAAKFTVKNSQNAAGEPDDCGGLPDCTRRKVELKSWDALESQTGTMLPYLSERWISVSHFIPADWDESGSGWGPTVFQLKPYVNNSGVSPMLAIQINKGNWVIQHRNSDVVHVDGQLPWQQQFFYSGNYEGQPYPREDFWPDGLRDFPNVADSHAALQSLNKGGWTDWVIHIRFDARGAASGGSGFLVLWKREDSGPWVKVLDIRPKVTTRGGMTFDHGIGYNEPPRPGDYNSFGDHGGHAIIAGMYMKKEQVWNLPKNRVIYNDNIRIGDENSSLTEMAPDIGTTNGGAPPLPPANFGVQ